MTQAIIIRGAPAGAQGPQGATGLQGPAGTPAPGTIYRATLGDLRAAALADAIGIYDGSVWTVKTIASQTATKQAAITADTTGRLYAISTVTPTSYWERTIEVPENATTALKPPSTDFNWFTTLGWKVTGCTGVYGGSINMGVAEMFEKTYAGVIAGGVLWASESGLDTGSGNMQSPFKTLNKSLRLTTNGTVMLMPGVYTLDDFRYTDAGYQANKPKRIIAPWGGVTIRLPGDDTAAATWTANGTYPPTYETTLTTTNIPIRVLDLMSKDEFGEPLPIPLAALEGEVVATAIAAVNNTVRGWWYDSAAKKLYLRDGNRNINTDKARYRVVYGSASRDNRMLLFATKTYWENIVFEGYLSALESAGQEVPEVWAKNCRFKYCRSDAILGSGAHLYLQDCSTHRPNADGWKYNSSTTIAHGVEIDCWSEAPGDPATFDKWGAQITQYGPDSAQTFNPSATGAINKNGSSAHANSCVIRVSTKPRVYHSSAGPTIADTSATRIWNIGIDAVATAKPATAVSYGVLSQGGIMWNHSVRAQGQNGGFCADASAVMYNYNCAGTITLLNSGTVLPWIPGLE